MHCRPVKTRVVLSLMCVCAMCMLSRSSWNLSSQSLSSLGSRLCACNRCLAEGDPWFRGVLEASPRPFLSRNYTISKDVFSWFQNMQHDKRNFTLYKTTVDKVFQMFPATPEIVESSPDRCMTCAVVGNSGNLKGSRYGPLIDFHDIVIRMNHGRTKGYEKDVGTKTTHHVMYPESAVNLDNATHLVLFPFKIYDLEWLIRSFTPAKNNPAKTKRANKDLVMVLNPAFMKYVHEMWLDKKGKYPSTGFMTLVFSMLICDEVNVFGFGADSNGNWNHYFETLKNKNLKTGPHPGNQEHEIIEKLHEQEKIYVFKGW